MLLCVLPRNINKETGWKAVGPPLETNKLMACTLELASRLKTLYYQNRARWEDILKQTGRDSDVQEQINEAAAEEIIPESAEAGEEWSGVMGHGLDGKISDRRW